MQQEQTYLQGNDESKGPYGEGNQGIHEEASYGCQVTIISISCTKYSVAKFHQYVTKFDKEWNEFKVTDATVDPDKVLTTLDKHTKKLKEFGD